MSRLSTKIIYGAIITGLLFSNARVADAESKIGEKAATTSSVNTNTKTMSQKAYISYVKKKLSTYKKYQAVNDAQYKEYMPLRNKLYPEVHKVTKLWTQEDQEEIYDYSEVIPPYNSYEKSKYIMKMLDIHDLGRDDYYDERKVKENVDRYTKKINAELKKQKVNRALVDDCLKIIRDSLTHDRIKMNYLYDVVVKGLFDTKEMAFLQNELDGKPAIRSEVEKNFTKIELEYIAIIDKLRTQHNNRKDNYLRKRKDTESRTNERELITDLSKLGNHIEGLIYDRTKFDKISPQKRKKLLYVASDYEKMRNVLINNGINSVEDLDELKNEVLRKSDASFSEYLKAADYIKDVSNKKIGKIDEITKMAHEMSYNYKLSYDILSNWDFYVFFRVDEFIRRTNTILKDIGMEMKE